MAHWVPGKFIEVEDEGSRVTLRLCKINFVGNGVTVTEEEDGEITVTISLNGGGDPPPMPMPPTHRMIAGFSIGDQDVTDEELAAGSPGTSQANLPDIGLLTVAYIFVWRSDYDGGDPAAIGLGSNPNWRNNFGEAVAREYDGVPGQLVVTTGPQRFVSGLPITVS